MKQIIFAVLISTMVFSSCTEPEIILDSDMIDNTNDSLSYALGLSICQNFRELDVHLNPEYLKLGFADFNDSTYTWDMLESATFINAEMERRSREKMMQEQAQNPNGNGQNLAAQQDGELLEAIGRNWLIENSTKPNVKQLPSGLQYEIIKKGSSKHPTADNAVTVHYTGTLLDGTKFDSSVDRGQPATFGLKQVIPGWTEGIPLIGEGGKIRLFIPHNLAYGPQGRPGIPPYATLIFDVELIAINN